MQIVNSQEYKCTPDAVPVATVIRQPRRGSSEAWIGHHRHFPVTSKVDEIDTSNTSDAHKSGICRSRATLPDMLLIQELVISHGS